MADILDLIDLPEAKRAVNIDAAAVTHDLELAAAITAISRRIDARCGPVVQRTITAERHDGLNGSLFPRYTPVVSITTLTEYSSGTGTVLTVEDFDTEGTYLLTSNGHDVRIARRSGWTASYWTAGATVILDYEAGRYADTAAVDARFKQACGAALRRWWRREAGAWAQGPDPFTDTGAPAIGFFRIIDPVLDELLGDQLLPPAIA